MATMAQITDALQKLPLHTYHNSPNKIATPTKSISDQQIIPRRSFSLLTSQQRQVTTASASSMDMLSTSMIIRPFAKPLEEYSEKERNVLQMTKASSVQHMVSGGGGMESNEEPGAGPKSSTQTYYSPRMTTTDLTGGYYDFSSCLQSRIDAQIVELARARSKNNKSRSSPTVSI